MGYWCDDKPACMQKNILATALNTGGGKWIGHQPIFQIFATFPNIEKVQDKPACNPERHTAKANKAKVESESWFSKIFLQKQLFQIQTQILFKMAMLSHLCGCCVDIWTEVMGLKSSRVQGYHRASAAVLSAPAAEKQIAAFQNFKQPEN